MSLPGCSGTKEPHLGPSLGLRSCSSRSFFPMTCHWMIGIAGVYALPTVWPDVSMLGATNLRRAVGYDFHLRKKYDVLSMWGNIHPQWRLLQQHLETKGPGWYPLSKREERLFTNRSRPGDDMKDELRTDGDPIAWRAWSTAQNQLWQLRQPAPNCHCDGQVCRYELVVLRTHCSF